MYISTTQTLCFSGLSHQPAPRVYGPPPATAVYSNTPALSTQPFRSSKLSSQKHQDTPPSLPASDPSYSPAHQFGYPSALSPVPSELIVFAHRKSDSAVSPSYFGAPPPPDGKSRPVVLTASLISFVIRVPRFSPACQARYLSPYSLLTTSITAPALPHVQAATAAPLGIMKMEATTEPHFRDQGRTFTAAPLHCYPVDIPRGTQKLLHRPRR